MSLKFINIKSKKIIVKAKGRNVVTKRTISKSKTPANSLVDWQKENMEHPGDWQAGFEYNMPDFEPIFFDFPFSWVWNNYISGVRFNANALQATHQIHILQDFDIVSENGSQNIEYQTSFVCVMVRVMQYKNLDRRIIAICSACDSSGYLIK